MIKSDTFFWMKLKCYRCGCYIHPNKAWIQKNGNICAACLKKRNYWPKVISGKEGEYL